ncbi:hypothetical protein L6452_00968 [Arctium lappa]|uniref:Uncharacterized protein n=1 Tax=Arctium lappa TaxID=4217 RepID=A0ACB9FEU7_ARCLA|nr:hypothetical protein L6452_00968 [Arctium lappa]
MLFQCHHGESGLRSRAVPVEGDEPADEIRVELPRDPAGRSNTRGRGRGRGRGPVRTTRRATTHVEGINSGNRGGANTRTARRARSARAIGNTEMSHQESSTTVRGRGSVRARGRGRNQAFVTHGEFAAEIGKHQEKSASGSKDKSDSREVTKLSSPPVTEVGACKPPTYKGECDPVLVMKWIKEMELVFATSKCAGEDKVTYSLSMLRSEATLWWDAETGGSGVAAAEGGISGIRARGEPTTFQAAVHATDMTEKEKNRQLTDRVGDKRKWDGPTADPRKGKNFKPELRMGRGVGEKPCGKCHRVHQGECVPWERSSSFGVSASQARGTSSVWEREGGRREEEKWEPARPKGRDFNMTATEAEEVPDVVAGTFLVNSTRARVLFDSGATCSFISPTFARCLGLKPKRLGREFGVETADANQVLVREVFEGCVIDIEGSLVPVVLFPMPMREFDVVIGMDWLAKNDASIICKRR